MQTTAPAYGKGLLESIVVHGGLCGVGEADADALYFAVGGGENFQAEAVLFDDFAGQRDVAGDLGDQTAEGRGLVLLAQKVGLAGGRRADRGWSRSSSVREAEIVRAGCGIGEEVAQAGDLEAAGDEEGAVGLANGSVLRFGLVMFIGDVADDGLEKVFDGDEAGDAAVLVDDEAHVLFLALHLAEEFGDVFGFGDKGGRALHLDATVLLRSALVSRACSRSRAKAMPVIWSRVPE